MGFHGFVCLFALPCHGLLGLDFVFVAESIIHFGNESCDVIHGFVCLFALPCHGLLGLDFVFVAESIIHFGNESCDVIHTPIILRMLSNKNNNTANRDLCN